MNDFGELENERSQLLKDIDFYLQQKQFNDVSEKELTANLSYLISSYEKAVQFQERGNTKLLNGISILNKRIAKLQRDVKKREKLYEEHRNMDKGIKQSLRDTAYSYKTLLYNIGLKDIVALGLLYWVMRGEK